MLITRHRSFNKLECGYWSTTDPGVQEILLRPAVPPREYNFIFTAPELQSLGKSYPERHAEGRPGREGQSCWEWDTLLKAKHGTMEKDGKRVALNGKHS